MRWITRLDDTESTQARNVGAKAARLAELRRVEGVHVPDGFCVTTHAFEQVVAGETDPAAIERLALPADLVEEIEHEVGNHAPDTAWAVRSSATAEDLAGASFAGQYESYLDVVGSAAVVAHVRRCWASLFTARAAAYRAGAGLVENPPAMAVLVQRQVGAQAAGVLFTADPVTSDRTSASVEAVAGLGEALVSGRATPQVWTVRAGEVVARPDVARPVLDDAQVLALVALGRRIEAVLDAPQDIEWCLTDDGFSIVQTRPVTTLFPVPHSTDGAPHVYVSVGHQQMMTDAMRPLGLSVWHLTAPRPMAEAGGRLFVDVAGALASPAGRERILDGLGSSDPLIGDALRTVLDRPGFIVPAPDDGTGVLPGVAEQPPLPTDPRIVTELVDGDAAAIAELARKLAASSGPAVFDAIRDDLGRLRSGLFTPRSLQAIMAGHEATRWLDEHLHEWLGVSGAADALAQGVEDNVTSQLGLALLDLADVVRATPAVVDFLAGLPEDLGDTDLLSALAGVSGGDAAARALADFLDRYGARCPGEIDITRTRWAEEPVALVPTILSNVANFAPGEAARQTTRGRQRAREAEHDLLERLRALPDGSRRAQQTEQMIERLRTFVGYREYPKFGMVRRYWCYKQALLREAERLVAAGVLSDRTDAYYLRFEQLHDAARTGDVDRGLIDRRRAEFARDRALTPPRVITSDGQVVDGAYRRTDLTPGALPGLAVSAGVAEVRARVVTDMARARLEPGDVLVTRYTDPSWTPLFATAGALVTEVGGLMTHGAVIAREYGLPAVVGVVGAVDAIPDGAWLRVDGTAGSVQVLEVSPPR